MKIHFKSLLIALLALGMSQQAAAEKVTTIGITTIIEASVLLDAKNGVLKALADAGYIEGKNLKVDYQSAQGNMALQQQIAKKFVGNNYDLIVSITTASSQAMYSATKDIPIIFTAVSDPIKAKLISQFKQPGGNITGVADLSPISKQIDLLSEILPNAKKLGVVYNPGWDNAVSAVEAVKQAAAKHGITVVESPAPSTNEVIAATRKLSGKVDALYVPDDATVTTALEAIVKVSWEANMPIFAADTGAVERGALASVGYNYFELGIATGEIVVRVLKGEKPGDINAIRAYEISDKPNIVINTEAAKKIGVSIAETTLKKAATVY